MSRPARVLVVEDDAAVRDVVRRYLDAEGYAVSIASDGSQGLDLARSGDPDLIVLDLMLPGISGLKICETLRAEGSSTPIIMLTALGEVDDRILGLSTGADDYVTKPFSVKELMLRVGSVLRRTVETPEADSIILDGELMVDQKARIVSMAGRQVALTAREFDLLAFLASHPAEVFSRDQLLSQVWGWEFGDHSTVTVHVKRLRRKIERNPAEPTRLMTVYGQGYRWDVEPAS